MFRVVLPCVGNLVFATGIPPLPFLPFPLLVFGDLIWCRADAEMAIERERGGKEGQGCQMAKFDPFLSLDGARVEGVGRNPRKGRDQILQRSVAIV